MLNPVRERGFSLIEMVVTMAILGMLTLALLPNLTSWVRNTNVRSAAESIQNGLQKARMEALRRNRIVTFWLVSPGTSTVLDANCTLSATAGSWVVSLDDPAGKCGADPSETADPRLVEAFSAGPQTDLTVTARARDGATAANRVSFNAYGQAVQTGTPIATIDVSPAGTGTGARNLRVAVSVGGGVRMCDRDVATTDPRACTN